MEGCARNPALPDQSAIPASEQLPLDGLWRMASGNTGSIFRIDKGRMYFYERRKALPKNSPLSIAAIHKDPKIRSAAELSKHPGEVIAKDIKGTQDQLTYTCLSPSYDAQRHVFGFGPGEIRVASRTQIVLKTLPNLDTGLRETIEESFILESLDNQSGDITSLNRKVIAVPPDKMESNGKLSKSANGFIVETVRNAKESNGSVVINCPPNAPKSVLKSLTNTGAKTFIDEHRDDYELVITKP